MSALDAVRSYAKRGWQVFPLIPKAKEPATWRGFYDATSNPAKLDRWFARGHPYNIGIRTGIASGIFVVDIDGDVGAASLDVLQKQHGPLPPTLISRTGNGFHYWFTTATEIPCSQSRIAPHIDVKADGGYVVAPPSIHPDGPRYRWSVKLVPASAPAWLVELAQRKPESPHPIPTESEPIAVSATSSAAYGAGALHDEIRRVALASSGYRNASLNRGSFCLAQLVAGRELHADEVTRGLIDSATANGLVAENGLRAVQATIDSGFNAGLRHPRDGWGRR